MTGFDPSPMGSGYSSFEEPYKSAQGRQPSPVGYDYSALSNEAVIKDMRFAARDLVEKLDDKLMMRVDRIYLEPPATTAFYIAFDHVLRDELTRQGYLLETDAKSGALPLLFVAKDVEKEDSSYRIEETRRGLGAARNNKDNYRDMALSLVVGDPKMEESYIITGVYEVPAYRHRKVDGVPDVVPVPRRILSADSYQK